MTKTLPADLPQKQLSVMLVKAGVVVFASYTGLMVAAWVMSLDGLYISVATVKDHNHNIFKKCGTRNRLELAKFFQ